MQALRLNEVLLRVVAWHNRHPLARRVTAAQVHSIGEVVLPFCSVSALQAAPPPPAPPSLPALPELLDPASAGGLMPAQDDAPAADPHLTPQTSPPPTPTTDALDALSTEAQADALFAPVDVPDPAEAESAAPGDTDDPAPADEDLADTGGPELLLEISAEPEPETIDPAPTTEIAEAQTETGTETEAAADIDATLAAPAHPDPSPTLDEEVAESPGDAAPAALAPPAPPDLRPSATLSAPTTPPSLWARLLAPVQTLWQTLRQRLPGSPTPGAQRFPRLQASFSRDFIWPMRPGRVAAWARHHASADSLAPADWPRREIEPDPRMRAAAQGKGCVHQVPLHLITAAIGVGDRRLRVLMGADGHIIGPRSYSPVRVASLGSVLGMGLMAGLWAWQPARHDTLSNQDLSAAVAKAASAAAEAASAAARLVAAAAAVESTIALGQAPPGSADLTHKDDETDPAAAAPAASANLAAAPSVDPAAHPEAAASASLANIRPRLDAADKALARQQAQALRGEAAPPPAAGPARGDPGPVYAVVTLGNRQRDSAARSLALMRASGVRLHGDVPENGELLQAQGEWRAAWWPFANQADAERARVMLAGRGVKVEVVEF